MKKIQIIKITPPQVSFSQEENTLPPTVKFLIFSGWEFTPHPLPLFEKPWDVSWHYKVVFKAAEIRSKVQIIKIIPPQVPFTQEKNSPPSKISDSSPVGIYHPHTPYLASHFAVSL